MAAPSSRAVRKTSTTVAVPARAASRLDVHSSKGGTSPFTGSGRVVARSGSGARVLAAEPLTRRPAA